MKLNYYVRCLSQKSIYKRWPFIKYKMDKNITKNGFTYYNFWYGVKDFWITEFIKSRKISNKPIDYISVFGPRNVVKYLNNKKIFFTVEDIGEGSINGFQDYDDYLLNDVDLSIGFREYNNKNYIRFPSRITALLEPQMRIKDIKNILQQINNREDINRQKFCTLIARHDRGNNREVIYKQLIKYGRIDCPSRFLHNYDINLPDYESKRKFMEDYRFNVCMENHSVKGYVTEKLIDAFRSKCIPIYNGIFTDFEKKIFNENAIINIKNQDWLKQIEYIQQNDSYYKDFISIKPFKKDAAEILESKLKELEFKIKEIMN